MYTLAIIPARGGSKGIPRKNLQPVGGTPLIVRAVTSCRTASLVDSVIVSTDDPDIASLAVQAGASVPYLRPEYLSNDTAPTPPVLKHTLDHFIESNGFTPSFTLLVEPTNPFTSPNIIDKAVQLLSSGHFRSVVSVCELERKPQNIFKKLPDGSLRRYIIDPSDFFTRRQDMNHLCRLSNCVYAFFTEDFLEDLNPMRAPVGHVQSSFLESINIDNQIDLLLAEAASTRFSI